jgi:hypothetical protein
MAQGGHCFPKPDRRVGLVGLKTPDISFYPPAAAPNICSGWVILSHAMRALAHHEGTYTFPPACAHPLLLVTTCVRFFVCIRAAAALFAVDDTTVN